MKTHILVPALLTFGLAVSGCAASALDANLVSVARSTPTTFKVKIRVDENAVLKKMAVSHMDVNQVPASVIRLADAQFPGSKIVGYELEQYVGDLSVVHEIEVETVDGKRCEVSANVEGALRYTECRIKMEDVPAPVTKTMTEALGDKAEILEVEYIIGTTFNEYRFEAKSAGRIHYLTIQNTGELVRHGILIATELEVPVKK